MTGKKKEPETWEKALTILGKTKGARLMALGIYLMLGFGSPFYILNGFGFYEPALALLFVFGILSFVVGLAMYTEEGTSGSRRGRSSR